MSKPQSSFIHKMQLLLHESVSLDCSNSVTSSGSPLILLRLLFPGSSPGKESACNAGDPGLIPGSGRSPGEGIGYPLQYSLSPLVAQLAKNPSAMQENWVQSLCWEDSLEKGKATHSSILAWRIPWLHSPWDRKESDTTERLSLTHSRLLFHHMCSYFPY